MKLKALGGYRNLLIHQSAIKYPLRSKQRLIVERNGGNSDIHVNHNDFTLNSIRKEYIAKVIKLKQPRKSPLPRELYQTYEQLTDDTTTSEEFKLPAIQKRFKSLPLLDLQRLEQLQGKLKEKYKLKEGQGVPAIRIKRKKKPIKKLKFRSNYDSELQTSRSESILRDIDRINLQCNSIKSSLISTKKVASKYKNFIKRNFRRCGKEANLAQEDPLEEGISEEFIVFKQKRIIQQLIQSAKKAKPWLTQAEVMTQVQNSLQFQKFANAIGDIFRGHAHY